MKARLTAGVLIGMLVAFGATGCTFVTPQATLMEGETSNGVSGQTGDVGIRNATLITDNDGATASLLVAFVNQSDRGTQVTLQYENKRGETVSSQYYVPANRSVTFGGAEDEKILLAGLDATAGSLFPFYFQTGDSAGKRLLVPVLTSDWQEYEGLAPTIAPRAR